MIVQLGLSDMINSNILSTNHPSEREVLWLGVWNKLMENMFTAEKYFQMFYCIFFYFLKISVY